jgi:ribosomal protein S18 acetylase RimI-like enzyme
MRAMAGGGDCVVRKVDRVGDVVALHQLDTSFTSEFIYDVKSAENTLHLERVRATSHQPKQFPIHLDHPAWDQGYVAVEDGIVRGFIASAFEAWNRRLAIWHFYVDVKHRQRGIGRRLMEHAIESGRRSGATIAWAETSNRNYPGIEVYRRLGFVLCGFDLTLYNGTPSDGEFAVYLARPITPQDLGVRSTARFAAGRKR